MSAWTLASFAALIALVPLLAHMALAPGITADEIVQRIYGDLILAYYRTGFVDRRALSYINLYLYGGAFELPAQWLVSTGILPWPVYESRHVLTAWVGGLGVVATWLSVHRIRGTRAASIAALLLLLTPAWTGHSLFNSKDIPFGVAASFVMYASVRIALRTAPILWSDALCAALALGAALGVRSGGMFLIAFAPATVGLKLLLTLPERTPGQQPVRAAALSCARLACTFPVAWLLMLSAWPWAQQAPFTRPFEAAAIAADFEVSGKTRFDGRIVSFGHLPADYLLTWFGVTLPDVYALAGACGMFVLAATFERVRAGQPLDRERVTATIVLCAFVFVPLLGVVITRPTLYDGHRHFLFLIPGLAALAGLALDSVLSQAGLPAAVRGTVAALGLALCGLTLFDMWSLHPYEYVYFNRASGGLPRQAARFETDYWGASYREGFAWVVQNYDRGGTRKITVKTCAADKVLGYYRRQWNAQRFAPATHGTPEIYLSITKRDCHKKPGELIHTVERQGVPLLYVLRRK